MLAGAGCSSAEPEQTNGSVASAIGTPAKLTIDVSAQHQRITGFGASSAWTGGNISDAQADQFFSPDTGIGLSMLRVHIAPDGTTIEVPTARKAVARGVAVWAAPWSPPGDWKTSGTETDGGSLLPERYQDWADRLVAFVGSMKKAGVPLVALSAQNEPNWAAEWETCVYTPEDLVTFVGSYLGPALDQASPSTKLISPETIDWGTLSQFADPLLADPDASAALDVVAVHHYGGSPYAYDAPGKELWETEVSYDNNSGLAAALETARQVQRHLTDGGVNAFHYWWLVSDTSGSLMQNGQLLPQAYGLGHYSKFIRPGYVRVDSATAAVTGVSSSAYFDPESHRTVLVVVNETSDDLPLSVGLQGAEPLQVTPWVTNETESLERQPVQAFANPFSYVFGSKSVTSLVLSETVDSTPDEGEGGTSGAAGAPSDGDPGDGTVEPGNGAAGAGAGDPEAGANGGAASDSPASHAGHSGTSDPTNPDANSTGIAPSKRGSYAACSLGAPESAPWSAASLIALLLLARGRKRS